MKDKIFNKDERKAIFKLFLTKNKIKFSNIQKQLDLRSNYLAYHIKLMVENNILEKKNDYYQITNDAQKYIPLFSNLSGEKLSPLPVCLTALINQNKALMIKRKNRPYKNYWSMIGGRILHDETYKEASLRLIEKKSGIKNMQFEKLCEIADEKVEENNKIQHAFILFFTKVNTDEKEFIETDYGQLKWIDLSELDNHKIIPSDLWLLNNSLNKKQKIKHVKMQSKDNLLADFKIE